MGLSLSVAPLWLDIVSDPYDNYMYRTVVKDMNKAILKQKGEAYTESRYKRRSGEKFSISFGSYNDLWEFRKYASRFENKSIHKIIKGECSTKFEHLIKHSDSNGYYLPVDFSKPFTLSYNQPFDPEPYQIDFCSSVHLKKELDLLNKELNIDVHNLDEDIFYKQKDDKFIKKLSHYGIKVENITENLEDFMLQLVRKEGERFSKLFKEYSRGDGFAISVLWIRLYQATIKSLQHKLPIIFQ